MIFQSTREIAARGARADSPSAFFSHFSMAWDGARSQVLKLETRQVYQEPGKPSLEAAYRNDWAAVRSLLPSERKEDAALYASVREKGIDFIRCRPLVFPLATYTRWEMEVYKENAAAAERIFCCNRGAIAEIFDGVALHDFMTFDARIAFIHDYDQHGQIVGGWIIQDADDIARLIGLHAYIKSFCQPFDQFVS